MKDFLRHILVCLILFLSYLGALFVFEHLSSVSTEVALMFVVLVAIVEMRAAMIIQEARDPSPFNFVNQPPVSAKWDDAKGRAAQVDPAPGEGR